VATRPVTLSVCIPTHNFGTFIADALNSVIRQAGSASIEIVVLDGASTDNTKDVVLSHSKSAVPVHYHYQPYKGGIDADMARVVELANGKYCWLLSADDALVDGAVERIFAEFQQPHDIYLCNRVWCDTALEPLDFQPWLRRQFEDASFSLTDPAALKQYMDKAGSIGGLFSFMSSIVVNRAAWTGVPDGLRLKGTNYAHVYRLFSMATRPDARVRYLVQPLILCRSGNDSFMANGVVARYLLDMRGYDELARHLFPREHELQRHFRAVVARQHRWFVWAWLASKAMDAHQESEIAKYLAVYGYSPSAIGLTRRVARSRIALFVAGRVDAVLRRTRTAAHRHLGFLAGRPARLAPRAVVRSASEQRWKRPE
jgi:abequosyltransferase